MSYQTTTNFLLDNLQNTLNDVDNVVRLALNVNSVSSYNLQATGITAITPYPNGTVNAKYFGISRTAVYAWFKGESEISAKIQPVLKLFYKKTA